MLQLLLVAAFVALLRVAAAGVGLPTWHPPNAKGVFTPAQFGVHHVDLTGELALKDGSMATVTAHVLLKVRLRPGGHAA